MVDDPDSPDVERYVRRYAARIAKWPQVDAFELLREDIQDRAASELLVNAFKEAARQVLAAETPLPELDDFKRKLGRLGRDAPIKVPKPQSPAVVKKRGHLRVVGGGDY